MRKINSVPMIILCVAPIFILLTIMLSILYGAKNINFETTWNALLHFDSGNVNHNIIITSRLPRVVAALLVGAFLAISGALMQGRTRNYLASPSIMGRLIICVALRHILLYDVYGVIIVDKEILKGSIDILLLSIIAKHDTYGYEIAQSLKQESEDLYSMGQGTLYPALKRLEKKEFLQSYWNESESGMKRKFYTITDKGKKELQKKVNAWERVTSLIQACQKGVIYE